MCPGVEIGTFRALKGLVLTTTLEVGAMFIQLYR